MEEKKEGSAAKHDNHGQNKGQVQGKKIENKVPNLGKPKVKNVDLGENDNLSDVGTMS